jgi:hypothetical protein
MLRVAIRPIRREKEGRLRAWLAELNPRADEVRQTFLEETVRAEQAFIVEGADGPLLIYAMEAEDFDRGFASYAGSLHSIDSEHREVMRECLLDSPSAIVPLYDVSLAMSK